jgi:hypothetical protein
MSGPPPPATPNRRVSAAAWALAAGTLALAFAVATDAAPWLRGVGSGIWAWASEPKAPDLALLPALALGVLAIALAGPPAVAWACRRGRAGRAVHLGLVVLTGWALQVALLAVEPGGAARTLIATTISPRYTSYHTVAILDLHDGVAPFLEHRTELLPELPLHAATHPAGPVLLYWTAWRFFAAHPGATRWVGGFAGLADVDPAETARLSPAQTPATLAAALAGAALLALAGAAAAIPIAALTSRLARARESGLRAAALWILVPGPLLMVPEVDQALCLPVAAAIAGLLAAADAERPGARVACGAAAGIAAALALQLSYGALVFLAGGACAAGAAAWGGRESRRRFWAGALAAGVTATLLFEAPALAGDQPVASALRALALHGDRHTWRRPWGPSIALDLADVLLFFGPPLVGIAALRAAAWQRRMRGSGWCALGPSARYGVVLVLGFLAALLSGTVRGEAGRIFLPWMGLLLAAACATDDAEPPDVAPQLVAALLLIWSVTLRLSLRLP